jgi:hypothetical protein
MLMHSPGGTTHRYWTRQESIRTRRSVCISPRDTQRRTPRSLRGQHAPHLPCLGRAPRRVPRLRAEPSRQVWALPCAFRSMPWRPRQTRRPVCIRTRHALSDDTPQRAPSSSASTLPSICVAVRKPRSTPSSSRWQAAITG